MAITYEDLFMQYLYGPGLEQTTRYDDLKTTIKIIMCLPKIRFIRKRKSITEAITRIKVFLRG